MAADDVHTEDAVLGGRLRLRQPKRGHRVGHDAILLAAATAAHAGEHAVELGAGVGAAGLAVAARVPGLQLTLVDIDPALVALAAGNAELNELHPRVTAVALDVTDHWTFSAANLASGCAHRVLMNPPFNDPARQQSSPDPARRQAHMAPEGTLRAWTEAAGRLLRDGGVLTLIWRADGLRDVLEALEGSFGDVRTIEVHPKPDAAPIRVLLRATKGAADGKRIGPPLTLNDAAGRPSEAAEAVLRHGAALPLAED